MGAEARVLVVEDDAGVAGGIVRGLRGAGFDVELAADGLEGTRKALERRFDAIVLDLMLPGQNGLAVLEQLKGRESVPILVLTARASCRIGSPASRSVPPISSPSRSGSKSSSSGCARA